MLAQECPGGAIEDPQRALHAALARIVLALDGDSPARVVLVENAGELADRSS